METNKPNHGKFAKSAAEVLAIVNNYKKLSPDLENFLRMKSHVVILKQCYIMFKNFSEFFAQYQRNFALPCLSVKWKPLCLKKKNHCCILQLFITIPHLTLYKEKYPTEKSEQMRSQCTYDQQ